MGHRVLVRALGETPEEALRDHLVIEPQDPPDPAALAEDDVVIAVRSAQVGWVDLLMTSGQYQHLLEPPFTPGLEMAGEVTWVGAAVERVAAGDRVIVDGLKSGPRSLGRHQRWGGFASWAVAPEDAVIPLPASLDFDEGAALLGGYETAYHALIHRGRLRAGEVVLILGASGSTGLAAVQIAKLIGAEVIATGRSPEKLAVVREAGADHLVATSEASLKEAVKALTGGRGVDVVYDPVGGELSLESLRCVAFGARYLIVGWAATPFVAQGRGQRGAPNANQLPTNLIMMKGLDVLGCPAVISVHRDPALRPPRLAAILRWVDEGRLRPRVAERYPLTEVHAAMRAKWESRAVGAIVLRP